MNIEEFISIINKYIELFTKYSKLMKKKAHSQVEQEEINSTSSLMSEVCKTYSEKLGELDTDDLVSLRDNFLLKLRELNILIAKQKADIKNDDEAAAKEMQKNGITEEYLKINGIAFEKEDKLEALELSKESYNMFVENINSWIKLRKPHTNGF